MTTPEILEKLEDDYPDCLSADGFDDAILGVVEGAGREPVICYDYARCIEILIEQGMDECEAQDYFEFNTIQAYVGETTPLFVHIWRTLEETHP